MAATTSDRALVARSAHGRGLWRRYAALLVVSDAVAILASGIIAQVLRFGQLEAKAPGRFPLSYQALVAVMTFAWLGAMTLGGTYDRRYLGAGIDEYRRVFDAALRFIAFVAVVAFVLKFDLARGFVVIAIPLATVFALASRYVLRRWLQHRRIRQQLVKRVVVVGTDPNLSDLVRRIRGTAYTGLDVVGVCAPWGSGRPGEDGRRSLKVDDSSVPVLAEPDDTLDAALDIGADAIAIADTTTLSGAALTRLAWDLAGTGIDLMVTPAITDVAGPRISVRPVADVPLLHAEQPELRGARRVGKEAFDRICATVLLLALSPFLVVIGLLVRLTSRGPALFRQVRVGLDGRHFTLFKFRTMTVNAEDRLAEVLHLNEHEDVLFKVRDDPRVTRVGRCLRRWSLDELPQLWNVLRGDMSIIGPRPPLPSEVESYNERAARRFLVKPGVTGLWQVSGRSSLSWQETVRLDLYYVENWSPTLDAVILAKTLTAVARRSGAF